MSKDWKSVENQKEEAYRPQYEYQESFKPVKKEKDRDYKKKRNKSKFDRFR